MEKYYLVRVVGTLARTVKVKADSIDDAFKLEAKTQNSTKKLSQQKIKTKG